MEMSITIEQTAGLYSLRNYYSMVEPFYDKTGELVHTEMWAQRFKDLRSHALALPKFGTDTADEEVS